MMSTLLTLYLRCVSVVICEAADDHLGCVSEVVPVQVGEARMIAVLTLYLGCVGVL
jgi:hypothetical protein